MLRLAGGHEVAVNDAVHVAGLLPEACPMRVLLEQAIANGGHVDVSHMPAVTAEALAEVVRCLPGGRANAADVQRAMDVYGVPGTALQRYVSGLLSRLMVHRYMQCLAGSSAGRTGADVLERFLSRAARSVFVRAFGHTESEAEFAVDAVRRVPDAGEWLTMRLDVITDMYADADAA